MGVVLAEKYRGGLGTHHAVRGHLDAAGEVREGCRLDIVRVSPHGVGHERRLASSRPGRTESGTSRADLYTLKNLWCYSDLYGMIKPCLLSQLSWRVAL